MQSVKIVVYGEPVGVDEHDPTMLWDNTRLLDQVSFVYLYI